MLNRIKIVLAEKDKTNKWLSEQLDKDPAMISKWVTNKTQPSVETLIQIAKVLATRTFSNHISAIADIFGIDIVCDRRDNTYRIDNDGDLGGSGLRNWMMEALSLNNLANESAGLRKRILFENGPSCHRFLTEVIRAVRDERMLEVNYKSFSMDAPRDFLLEPFCLKEYKSRWYLFARDHNGKYFFGARYGVLHYEGEEPACVKLKVCARQAEFFKLAVEMHAAYTHVRAKGGAGWNQGELAQLQLGLLTLTAFLLTPAQNMSR